MIVKTEGSDPRIKRTRGSLREALMVLINEKGFDSITVWDLASYANINRATFYLHYKDKFELLHKTMDEMLEQLAETAVAPYEASESVSNSNLERESFHRILEHVKENAPFYQVMLGRHAVPGFSLRIARVLDKLYRNSWETWLSEDAKLLTDYNVFLSFVVAAHIGMISYWLRTGLKYTTSYLADQMTQYTFAAAHSVKPEASY